MKTTRIPAPWWVVGVLLSIALSGGVRDVAAETTFTYVKIVDTATPIPGGTGFFTSFGEPGLANGLVAFSGEGVGNYGIFTRAVDPPTSLVARYDKNTIVPGTTNGRFLAFGPPSISPGGMAFKGGTGLYSDFGGVLVPSENTAGRGRTLSYTLVVSNKAGPDTAKGVKLTTPLPAGTTFAGARTSQGVIAAPAIGAPGTLIVSIESIAPGGTVTVILIVNVLSSAPSVLTGATQVSFDGRDPATANNTAQAMVKVVTVGTFVLTPGHTTVATGDHARLALEWTIPGPSWRELKTLDLRVRDHEGTVLEGTPMRLALAEGSGRFGPAKEPGSHAVLSNSTAKVYLKGTTVTADGPNDPSVVLTLDVSFKGRAAGRSYDVEVRASDDLGNVQDWMKAGTLTVRP